ncbi:93e6b732-17f6-428e-9f8d-d8e003f39abd [Sclerotinia trifoliorum]|uniref:ferric-chelate reductase (NADPH) n=1 Tax=Sclerotinia trifoliorum TaxID=28548 RepID=A0A8H2VXE3_9HELO|nr:93e6b732-17f6-428e-9f8d-d8e003f39abd [Sclerotinia trifoliorum]
MDMSDGMAMGGAPSDGSALNDTGFNFSNMTQAADFLGEILDDSVFQIKGNAAARHFWYGVCAVIATAAFFNFAQKATTFTRLRAAAANRPRPASSSNFLTTSLATITAIGREASYPQFIPQNSIAAKFFKIPPFGTIILLVLYLVWVVILEFANNNVPGAQHFTSLGVRASWLAVAQVPLLILLAGKSSPIGLVSGISYERLNVIHRWTSRVIFFLVTLHVIFLHLAWNAYDLGHLEYSTDSCVPTGWGAYAVLIWMNISTCAPIRNFSYEFFVVQHIITFFGFIIAVIMHLPDTALYSRVYIYIPIALYIIDRMIRTGRYAWNNIHTPTATLTVLEGGVTRVCIESKTVKKWTPGSHVLLSIPQLGLLQSHPATIASTPSSHEGKLVFLLKGHKGFTGRLLYAAEFSTASNSSWKALIDGPYGKTVDYAAFDTVVLISGSTGTTYALPILLDIASRAQSARLPVRRIVFVWIIKNTSWTSWIAEELTSAAEKLNAVGIELTIRIHVTCDNNFTTGDDNIEANCCACDKSLGSCCCISIDSDTDDDEITSIAEKGNKVTSKPKTTSASSIISGTRSSILPCAVFHSGRPDFHPLLGDLLEKAEGETGIAVCGPPGLSSSVRTTVARCSNDRAVHKGTGAQGIYLHAEGFGW